jgi:phosphatidylserine/phosphatidylglycerophosphate/cardiolipin synthase-like enzyme
LLVIGVSAPAMPASSVASGAALATCFAPEEDCAAFAVRAIDNAEHDILVGAYGLTTGSGIVEALIRAKERGIDVRLIADKTAPCTWGVGLARWRPLGCRSGSMIRRIAHAKTMVIDGAVTLMGSFNWTTGCRAELRRSEPSLVADGRRRLCGSLAHASSRLGPV